MFTSFSIAAIWTVVKTFVKGMTLRQWLYVLLAVAALLGMWRFYAFAYERGQQAQHRVDAKILKDTNDKLASAESLLSTYRGAYKSWLNQSETAEKKLQSENKILSSRLDTALKNASKIASAKQKVLIREIPKFIPAAVDVSVPAGFVRLYDHALLPTASARQDGELSFGTGFDAAAPSGLTLSGIAPVLIENNAECVVRGEVIEAWQTWYKTNKASFEELNKAQQSESGTLNTPITPPSEKAMLPPIKN